MTDYIKVPFTGRADGKPIRITALTLGSAQTIHTTNAGTTTWDEVWLWVVNPVDVPASITIVMIIQMIQLSAKMWRFRPILNLF